jgi:hypothetical protein
MYVSGGAAHLVSADGCVKKQATQRLFAAGHFSETAHVLWCSHQAK